MNIIKLQNQLRGVPDNTLIGYVQNPTGQVPTYLALSELQRRKEMRSKYQANQPEDKTVAEDLVQESQPGIMALPEGQAMQMAMEPPPEMPMEEMAQGGLADLDTGDMYDENRYANGGIVAFAGPEGSYVQSSGANVGVGKYTPLEDLIELTPEQINALPPDKKDYYLRAKAFRDKMRPIPKIDKPRTIQRIPGLFGDTATPATTEPKTNVVPPVDTSIKKQIEEATKNPFTDKELFSSFTSPVEKIGSIKSYADELKDYVGEDPMRQKLTDRLAKMETRAAKMEEQAPWMALARAGFEMASSRPEYGRGQSALADIARGAGVGIKDFVESRDRLNTLEEKRFNIENDLAKANRAEQMAIAKYGADSKQAAEARAHADRLHNSSVKTQFKIAELNAATNANYRMATIKNKIDDDVRAKIKQVYGEGALTPEEYDRHFKRFLAEEYNKYGITGAPAVTESMPGNMVFDPKTKEYTYKPKS